MKARAAPASAVRGAATSSPSPSTVPPPPPLPPRAAAAAAASGVAATTRSPANGPRRPVAAALAAARSSGPLSAARCRPLQHARRAAAANGAAAAPLRAANGPAADGAGDADGGADDIDDLILDDAYYAEYGMTKEDALRQQLLSNFEDDPDAAPADARAAARLGLGSSGLGAIGGGGEEEEDNDEAAALRRVEEALEAYGPEALVMAGFRAEEYAMTRALLDALGGAAIKVLPATEEMLAGTVGEAVRADEIDWALPRPADWVLGGAWGSQRAILFSGLPVAEQVRERSEGQVDGDECDGCVVFFARDRGGGAPNPMSNLSTPITSSSLPATLSTHQQRRPSWSSWRPRGCRTCA